EVPMRYAISIEQNKILTSRNAQRLIQNDGFPEALVLVPKMMDRNRNSWTPCVDQMARLVAGTIIGNENFIRQVALAGDAVEHLAEGDRLIIGADDERYLHCGRALRKRASRTLAYRVTVEKAFSHAI